MITYVTNDSGNVRKCYWTQGLKHWTRTNNIQINMVEFHIITLGEEIGTSIKAVERAFQVFNDRFKAWLIGLFMSWNFLIAQKILKINVTTDSTGHWVTYKWHSSKYIPIPILTYYRTLFRYLFIIEFLGGYITVYIGVYVINI